MYSVCYMLVIHFFQTFEIFRFISSGALKQFLKDFKNNTQLSRNFLRATITASFFRLCIILETLVYRRILTMCRKNCIPSSLRHWFTRVYSAHAAKTVSHTVLAFSPSSPKLSVPSGKPNKFLKIN